MTQKSEYPAAYCLEQAKKHRNMARLNLVMALFFFWTLILPAVGYVNIRKHKRAIREWEEAAGTPA